VALGFGSNRNLETLILREAGKPEKPDLTKKRIPACPWASNS